LWVPFHPKMVNYFASATVHVSSFPPFISFPKSDLSQVCFIPENCDNASLVFRGGVLMITSLKGAQAWDFRLHFYCFKITHLVPWYIT
jgi:hypothetical protein